ncbi:MAG TPA: pilus assembly PilX N-terminal domain-containing protein [Ramlibacter sp.]|nr:pilus assembly PilX N-terminal domain-containing protein [Ramlibacter sp.]
MKPPIPRPGPGRARLQRGATLIIGLIMIVLITLIVVNAFTLSSSNLKSVGNMQARDEALAAANQAIESMISSPFTNAIGTQTFTVDINKDGTNDYTVVVNPAVCIAAVQASAGSASDVELIGMSSGASWNTDWDIRATVTDSTSGASVVVREGVRVRLSQSQKDTACP